MFWNFRGFKALKQTVKLYYRLGKYKEMMESYRVMLTYIRSAVTRNYSEKCINNIMDFVSGSASQNFGLLQEFYQTTLKALEEAKNEVRELLCLIFISFLWENLKILMLFLLIYDRGCGLKQTLSFARSGLIWGNMGEWIRYLLIIYFISALVLLVLKVT